MPSFFVQMSSYILHALLLSNTWNQAMLSVFFLPRSSRWNNLPSIRMRLSTTKTP